MTPLEILLAVTGLLLTSGFAAFALTSLREGHTRAARRAVWFALASLVTFTLLLFAPTLAQQIAAAVLALTALLSLVLFFLPKGKPVQPSPPPTRRVDERTIIFARARLQPSTARYNEYYRDHPEHQAPDDAFRANPGLLALGAVHHDPLLSGSPVGGFFLTESLRDAVDGPVAPGKVTRPPEQMTRFIKRLATYHGAHDVGVCALQPYHIYSHIGRGSGTYGAPVALDHAYAIAFTVEMAHEMVNTGPRTPAVMESARQYAQSGTIAVILAAAIRALGYSARAPIDGNYRVIAPLVAKDAGLGEIGRMILLMTPRLGPRVRLAVVTTDLPLVPDAPAHSPAMLDFCSICKKCAEVCPAQAIPLCERQAYPDGTLRWKIDPEKCYTYWTQIGTDCGRCMAVCPYAHADTPLHNLIRLGVSRSANFRRAAIALDDLFYGHKPKPHALPDWLKDLYTISPDSPIRLTHASSSSPVKKPDAAPFSPIL